MDFNSYAGSFIEHCISGQELFLLNALDMKKELKMPEEDTKRLRAVLSNLRQSPKSEWSSVSAEPKSECSCFLSYYHNYFKLCKHQVNTNQSIKFPTTDSFDTYQKCILNPNIHLKMTQLFSKIH